MRLAMIGLGKMGANMTRRLLRGGHEVIGYDQSPEAVRELASQVHMLIASTLNEAISPLPSPRIVWLMVPAGEVTETTLLETAAILKEGDIIVDGGNSNFEDSIRRGNMLREKGIQFLDVGTSGGIWGLQEGYAMMIGGDPQVVEYLRPIFATLAPAPDKGWGRVGPNGSGHFVKMIHNGIEYGLMEAYGEGFELMRARKDFQIDLYQVSQIWRFGSVVRSWLLDLFGYALENDPELPEIKDEVADSGEGRWTVNEAVKSGIPAPIITMSLFRRFESQQGESYAYKLLAAVRHQFGGHSIPKKEA